MNDGDKVFFVCLIVLGAFLAGFGVGYNHCRDILRGLCLAYCGEELTRKVFGEIEKP